MKENNYDNPGFFSQYRRFPRSVEGLSRAFFAALKEELARCGWEAIENAED